MGADEALPAAFVAKYAERIGAMDMTVEQFAAAYAQTIRLAPRKALGWHGRSQPRSVIAAARRVARSGPVSLIEPMRVAQHGVRGEPLARPIAL